MKSFDSKTSGKFYENLVKSIFTFLAENNLLINDGAQHIIAIQFKADGHHVILLNKLENEDAKNIEFFDKSLQADTKRTVVFSYDSKHITMNFSEGVKHKTKGVEKYVNLKSKSFLFDRKEFNFLEIQTNSFNNLLDMLLKDTTVITSLNEKTSMMNKIRLKYIIHDDKISSLQIDKLCDTYHQEEMFFYKKNTYENQNSYRVEVLATRFTCTLEEILLHEMAKKILPKNLISIFYEIISQLKTRGFPHGDLNPRNFLLREDDKNNLIYLKIIDSQCTKIDGHLRGGRTLKDELSIDDITTDMFSLSRLASKFGLEELKTMLENAIQTYDRIHERNPRTGQDALIEEAYGFLMEGILSYLSSLSESDAEESALTSAESIKKSSDEVVEKSLKPS